MCMKKFDAEKIFFWQNDSALNLDIFWRPLFSSPEQSSRRAIVLPPASALALALVSTNVTLR